MNEHNKLPDQLGRANPGSRHNAAVLMKGIDDVRLFLGADKNGVIMPAMSSTHAVFRTVAAVVSTQPGTNVVTTNLEHPSVYDSTRKMAETYGKQWRVADVHPKTGFVPIESILERIDKHTCLVSLVHGSNITGVIHDIKTLAAEAKKINPDVFVMTDGVQYAPHAPIDVVDLGVDAYIFGPYKVFCAKGIGFAYLSERLGSLDHWKLKGKAANDWMLGSAEEATYAGWSAVVDYFLWLGTHFTDAHDRRSQLVAGLKACHRHEQALLSRALHGSRKRAGLFDMSQVTTYALTDEPEKRACLILFNIDRLDSYQAVELYNQRGIRVHNRVRDAYSKHTLEVLGIEDAVRLSGCHYNTPEEIDRFLEVTAELGKLSDAQITAVAPGPKMAGPGEG